MSLMRLLNKQARAVTPGKPLRHNTDAWSREDVLRRSHVSCPLSHLVQLKSEM